MYTGGRAIAAALFADFDGDGYTDAARSAGGQWLVSWGGRTPWRVLNWSVDDLRRLVIADVNGDHKADVLIRRAPGT